MRNIAIIKNCDKTEKELILSSIEINDKIMFLKNEDELLANKEYENVEIIFGEPEISNVKLMKKLRWIRMSWAGANKYTSVSDFPDNLTITCASGAYGHAVSEYVVSGVLALTRKLFLYREQVLDKK